MNPLSHFRKISFPRLALLGSLSLSALVLICYGTLAQGRHTDAKQHSADRVFSHTQIPVSISEPDGENDPAFVKRRQDWLHRFFGLGSVSPAEYARAIATARALPMSPLVQHRQFAPAATWTFPVPPPILGDYGNDGSTRIQALALNPLNTNIIWTGSFGGLARSTNAGNSWTYLSDTWASQAISCIAVNPSMPSTVYVGTGMEPNEAFGVGLYRTADSGGSWVNIGGTQFGGSWVKAIVVDPNATSNVYVAMASPSNPQAYPSGVYRSTDSGTNWTLVRAVSGSSSFPFNGIHDFAIDPSTHPSTLYIADDTGVLRSIDSGNKWSRSFSVGACDPIKGCRWSVLSVVNSSAYFAGGVSENRHLYSSNNDGISWSQIPTPCPCGSTTTCAQRCTQSCPPNGCNNIGLGVFAVDPTNPQIIVGGTNGLFRTGNGGTSWTEISGIHPDTRVLAFSPNASGVAYDGNDGGLFKSTDHGQTWISLNHTFPGAWLYSIASSQDGTMVAGTQDAGVVFSDPLAVWGRAWEMIFGGDSSYALVDPQNGTPGYLDLYDYASFRRFNRSDPIHTMVQISPSQLASDCLCQFFPVFSMNLSSPTHLIAACQQVVRTLNGPTVTPTGWTTIGPSPLASPAPCATAPYVVAVSEAPNPDVIYAVTSNNKVYITSNAGLGGQAQWYNPDPGGAPPSNSGIRAVTVDPNNSQNAYLACNVGVFKTTDWGHHWNASGLTNFICRDVAINSANGQLFVATNLGVWTSTNGGGAWSNLSAGSIPNGIIISALNFNRYSSTLAAATQGRGVYTIYLGP